MKIQEVVFFRKKIGLRAFKEPMVSDSDIAFALPNHQNPLILVVIL